MSASPYHEPHEWAIDFPKLMSRAKLVQAREQGIPLPERLGQRQDLLGKLSCLSSALTNAAFKNRAVRSLMEKATGIDRRWIMPTYESQTASSWLKQRRAPAPDAPRVILFSTCFVEYSEAEVGHAALEVLEHNGIAAEPSYPACCGAPFCTAGIWRPRARTPSGS